MNINIYLYKNLYKLSIKQSLIKLIIIFWFCNSLIIKFYIINFIFIKKKKING